MDSRNFRPSFRIAGVWGWMAACALFCFALPSAAVTSLGTLGKWGLLEIRLQGPSLNGYTGSPNPFAIRLDGIFRGPDGAEYRVPGFFDGNGNGGQSGNVWKIRFVPDQTGDWTMTTESSQTELNGQSFSFQVEPSSRPGFLRYVGGYYLKFLDGPYWFKAGVDDPEEFLGETVFGGWPQKRVQVDHLAAKGVNSMYIVLLDYPGDSGLVFPWLSVNDQTRYDIDKMRRWESMFDYIRDRQMVLHLVLEDDGALIPANRENFYRYIIARFGHHTGLIWNLREEYNERYSSTQAVNYSLLLQQLDPYDHPIAVHNVNAPVDWYLRSQVFSATSIQTELPSVTLPPRQFNAMALEWRQAAQDAGHPMMISFDETGKISSSDKDRSNVRRMSWCLALANAQCELHVWPLADYAEFDSLWNDLNHLKTFMLGVPFWEMRPDNSLVSPNAVAMTRAGHEIVAYSIDGLPVIVDLSGQQGIWNCVWYHPRTGQRVSAEAVPSGGVVTLTPPFGSDAVFHLVNTKPEEPVVPEKVVIENLQPSRYRISQLYKDSTYYVDRTFTLIDLPDALQGLTCIKTANDDKANADSSFISFSVDRPANILIAFDSRVDAKPEWLSNNFVLTDWSIGVSDKGAYLQLWNRTVAPGMVQLGGTAAPGFAASSSYSAYFVVIQPYLGAASDPYPPSPPQGVQVFKIAP
ncbi:MAG TPA: DUF5060 domain-containing protein [bacterium]|nr:DUF5060 domain-containing protein [bacterium]